MLANKFSTERQKGEEKPNTMFKQEVGVWIYY